MDITTSRRSFLAVGGAGLASLAVGAAAPAGAAPRSGTTGTTSSAVGGTITDLGEPVQKTQTQCSAIGTDPEGRPVAYLVGEGGPSETCEFAVVDLRSQKTTLDVRIEKGNSTGRAMSISPATGDVYFGTTDGAELYRYRAGAANPEYLGTVMADQDIWSLRVGDDGVVWVGTYPGGLLLSYDPATGKITNHGQALAGEQYIGAVQPVGGTVYCGTQPNGRLAGFDISTGAFSEVALPNGPVASQIDAFNLVGTLLFVSTGGQTYVRDLTTGSWTDTIPQTSGYGVSQLDPATGTVVYVRSANVIKSYNVQTKALQSTGWAPNAAPEKWAWIDLDGDGTSESIAFTYWNYGRIYALDPQTKKSYYLQPQLMGAGDQLVAIGAGPDGNIYCGAYLSPPGMGRWDPDKGAFELLTGTSQVEGFGSFNGDLVFGRYPQGRLYRYDLDKPWSGTNPGPTVDLEGYEQNRPQCFVQVDDTTVAVTTVPITGRLNGAITLWNPNTNAVDVHRGVIQNQTPVSLVLHDGVLIGGTSINGGYGIDPVAPEAKLFAWDPTTFEVAWQLVPVSGATTVAGLIIDEKAQLWGIADNVLFQFDLFHRRIMHRTTVFPNTDGSRYGNDHVLRILDGHMFGVTSNRMFEFDRQSRQAKVIYDGPTSGSGSTGDARHLAVDRYGDLYFIGLASHVMRYRRK